MVLSTTPVSVFADEITEIKSEISKAEQALVDSKAKIEEKKKELEQENEKLTQELKETSSKIKDLSQSITARSEQLKNQARLQQLNEDLSDNFWANLLSSKSIAEASRKTEKAKEFALSNAERLKEQESDKKKLEESQKASESAYQQLLKNQELLQSSTDEYGVVSLQLEIEELQYKLTQETNDNEVAKLTNQLNAKKQELEKAKKTQEENKKSLNEKKEQLAKLTNQSVSSIYVGTTSTATGAVVETGSQTINANYSQYNAYPVGQCTWGAKALAPWSGNFWGNANMWAYSAAAEGFTVSTTPKVGAIAVWTEGQYGHVAVVTEVQSDSAIRVMESNYNGIMSIGDYRGIFNPHATYSYSPIQYIYPPA